MIRFVAGTFDIYSLFDLAGAAPGTVFLDIDSRVVARAPADGGGASVYLTPNRFRVFFLLAASHGLVSREQIIEQLYGDEADGGPECIYNVVSVYLTNLRQQIAPLRLAIENESGRGWRLCDMPRRAAPAIHQQEGVCHV
jgi:DNA-binding response OmpR family regulator